MLEVWATGAGVPGLAARHAAAAEQAGYDGLVAGGLPEPGRRLLRRPRARGEGDEPPAARDRRDQSRHPPPRGHGGRDRGGARRVGRPRRARHRARRLRARAPRLRARAGRRVRARARGASRATCAARRCPSRPTRTSPRSASRMRRRRAASPGCRATSPKVPVDVAATGPKMIEIGARLAERVTFAVGADPARVRWAIETRARGPPEGRTRPGRPLARRLGERGGARRPRHGEGARRGRARALRALLRHARHAGGPGLRGRPRAAAQSARRLRHEPPRAHREPAGRAARRGLRGSLRGVRPAGACIARLSRAASRSASSG